MGKGVAKVLAGLDQNRHEIILLCRSKRLGEAVTKELADTTGNNKVTTIICDLMKLSDVKRAINELQDQHDYLDGIFINAGIGYSKHHEITADGLDAHFQVNYLSHFMLTLNLLNLLENSKEGGRVIFNTPAFGEMIWDDLQLQKEWHYEKAIGQSMVAKRMFLYKLHQLYSQQSNKLSFVGFSIHKTVWSNQMNIIPPMMRVIPAIMWLFGFFISIEECGRIMAPLFTEKAAISLQRSGSLMTWKNQTFIKIAEKPVYLEEKHLDQLWQISLDLCADERTKEIAATLDIEEI